VVTVAHEQAAVTAQVDRDLVSRVIQNLLANALKFTPARGSVRVTVVQGTDVVRVEVADSGPGIAPADRERIFEKFGQVSARAEGRQYASTGLGLAFCKLAVESHGGCIGVDSEEGEGSTFWFTLPPGEPHGQS
jgi:signal transduction histidine kinase